MFCHYRKEKKYNMIHKRKKYTIINIIINIIIKIIKNKHTNKKPCINTLRTTFRTTTVQSKDIGLSSI
jgi:DNA gyrase/topoisomerase IV subunit A